MHVLDRLQTSPVGPHPASPSTACMAPRIPPLPRVRHANPAGRPGPRPLWGILRIGALGDNYSCLRLLQHALHCKSGRSVEGGFSLVQAVAHWEDFERQPCSRFG